jgi:hypothetical protein
VVQGRSPRLCIFRRPAVSNSHRPDQFTHVRVLSKPPEGWDGEVCTFLLVQTCVACCFSCGVVVQNTRSPPSCHEVVAVGFQHASPLLDYRK